MQPDRTVAALVGSWRIAMTTWADDGTPTRADGLVADVVLIGGGRYAREQVTGDFAGASHEKLTLFGWNATRARYEYMTADNHDGVILLYTTAPGAAPGDAPINLFADYALPGDDGAAATFVTIRTVVAFDGPDRRTVRNHYRPASRPERLFLEYVYTRHDGGPA